MFCESKINHLIN